MSDYKIIFKEASSVLVGSFNPAIFHPEWLARYELISADDLQGAKIEIVHPDISKFTLDWLGFDIIRNRFTVRTNDPSRFDPLRDLLISIFTILEHTPLQKLGINLTTHYQMSSEDDWHKIGDTLAPKHIWRQTLPDRVGLRALTIESPRPDGRDGHIRVDVAPIEPELFRVSINVNSHFELNSPKEENNLMASEVIAQNWDDTLKWEEQLAESIIRESIKS